MFGILCYKKSLNLGDEIQSIATYNLLAKRDITPSFLIDRDTLDVYQDEKKVENHENLKVIINGWFDGSYSRLNLENKKNLIPLLISFHIDDLNTKNSDYGWLKSTKEQWIPLFDRETCNLEIGCRDIPTMEYIKKYFFNMKPYLSYCCALTLDKHDFKPLNNPKLKYLVIDADIQAKDLFEKCIPKEVQNNAYYKYQGLDDFDDNHLKHSEKWEEALSHLRIIRSCQFLITSRLHSALPAISFGKPVIFLHPNFSSDTRLGTYRDFFYKVNEELSMKDFDIQNNLDIKYILKINSRKLRPIRELIDQKIDDFIKSS